MTNEFEYYGIGCDSHPNVPCLGTDNDDLGRQYRLTNKEYMLELAKDPMGVAA